MPDSSNQAWLLRQVEKLDKIFFKKLLQRHSESQGSEKKLYQVEIWRKAYTQRGKTFGNTWD